MAERPDPLNATAAFFRRAYSTCGVETASSHPIFGLETDHAVQVGFVPNREGVPGRDPARERPVGVGRQAALEPAPEFQHGRRHPVRLSDGYGRVQFAGDSEYFRSG